MEDYPTTLAERRRFTTEEACRDYLSPSMGGGLHLSSVRTDRS